MSDAPEVSDYAHAYALHTSVDVSSGRSSSRCITHDAHLLQTTSVVIDNINIHVLPPEEQPAHPDVPPTRSAVCPAQLLTFDELTQLGDL
jgi:hypothetical protein